MKRFVAALAFVAVALSSPAFAQRNLDFTVLNRTGLTIAELYVSPSKSDEWEEDILGRDVLPHGESVEISFSRSETSCAWDMKIVDSDGDAVSWSNLDLCQISHVTLMYEDGKPTAVTR